MFRMEEICLGHSSIARSSAGRQQNFARGRIFFGSDLLHVDQAIRTAAPPRLVLFLFSLLLLLLNLIKLNKSRSRTGQNYCRKKKLESAAGAKLTGWKSGVYHVRP